MPKFARMPGRERLPVARRLGAALLYGAAALAAIGTPVAQAEMTTADRAAFTELAKTAIPNIVVYPELRERPGGDFTDADGQTMTLADFEGRVVVLNVWATWCPPCRKEMPSIDRLAAALAGEDAVVVALSTDRGGKKPVEKFFREVGIETLAIYNDKGGDVPRSAAVIGLPATLLLDREGREVARLTGDAEWDTPEVVAMVRHLIAATDPAAQRSALPRSSQSLTAGLAPSPIEPTTRAANGTAFLEGKARDAVNRDSPLAGTAL
ncbi:MAG: TlpA disulfide reductase family protein [Pseudomonadota bacterium]